MVWLCHNKAAVREQLQNLDKFADAYAIWKESWKLAGFHFEAGHESAADTLPMERHRIMVACVKQTPFDRAMNEGRLSRK